MKMKRNNSLKALFLKKSGIQLAAGYRFSFIFTDQGISNEA